MNTPLYNALKAYANSGILPFHMPGHKLGRGLPQEFLNLLAAIDVTELPGTDNFHNPEGAIREAQELAAQAFGAKSTFFLVNGSTCGIHAMIRAVCRPGDTLIVSRDCHRSVITGMMDAQVKPVYVEPEYDEYFGIYVGLNPIKIKKALDENPQAAGVLVTRPNYTGVCCNLKEISRAVHEKGKVLAVDEAHGAHLSFSGRLPDSALECGADICVQSAHKTLPALTQAAMLHVGSDRIDGERLKFYLKALQTSSPSYIIMASIDIAREIMQTSGGKALAELIDAIEEHSEKCSRMSIDILRQKDGGRFQNDPTRVVINVRKLGIPGYEAEKKLRDQWKVQAEMSDIYNVVFIATAADDRHRIRKLFEAVGRIAETGGERSLYSFRSAAMGSLPVQCIELKDIMDTGFEKVDIADAAGRISRDIVAPYPPGVPLLCPGEMITEEAAELIKEISALGGYVQGLDSLRRIAVVR